MLAWGVVSAGGAENQIEIAGDRRGDGFYAAGAEDLEVGAVAGPEADVVDMTTGAAVFNDEVGLAFHGHRAELADVGGVVEDSGGDGFLDLERFVYELDWGD